MTPAQHLVQSHADECGNNAFCWAEHWAHEAYAIIGPKWTIAIGVGLVVLTIVGKYKMFQRKNGGG